MNTTVKVTTERHSGMRQRVGSLGGRSKRSRTERVRVKNEAPDNWFAKFEGKWRKVHIQLKRLYIVCHGEKITIQIEGV